jgi:hypothetical protein
MCLLAMSGGLCGGAGVGRFWRVGAAGGKFLRCSQGPHVGDDR